MAHVILFFMKKYFYISTFRSMFAVPHASIFCSSLMSHFPVMLLRYFLNDLEMVPVAAVITGITFAFTFPLAPNLRVDQKVSVLLTITVQSSGAKRLFDHPVYCRALIF